MKAIELMDDEMKLYDKVFEEIMHKLEVTAEVWQESTSYYF